MYTYSSTPIIRVYKAYPRPLDLKYFDCFLVRDNTSSMLIFPGLLTSLDKGYFIFSLKKVLMEFIVETPFSIKPKFSM